MPSAAAQASNLSTLVSHQLGLRETLGWCVEGTEKAVETSFVFELGSPYVAQTFLELTK